MPPQIDLHRPDVLIAEFTAEAAKTRAALDDLARDDGRDPKWKNRARAEVIDALDRVRERIAADLAKWSTAAAKEAATILGSDTRTPDQVSVDMGLELRAARFAKSVDGETMARNILYAQAERFAATGNDREARAYAMAAQQHGVAEATRLLAQLEDRYRASWAGHEEGAQLATAAEAKIADWRLASAAALAQVGYSAVAAATAAGDLAAVPRLSDEATVASIAAKQAAARQAQATGTPYVDPVGPTAPAGHSTGPAIGRGDSATHR